MPTTASYARSREAIRESLLVFNRDARSGGASIAELASDVVRRTAYWVFDPPSGLFGPAKFVAFEDMNFARYARARVAGVEGARFDGFQTRNAIAKVCGAFKPNPVLNVALRSWASVALSDRPLEGVAGSKWRFAVTTRLRPRGVVTGWSEWTPFTLAALGRSAEHAVPNRPGAYRIRAVVAGTKFPRVIRRCCGEDENGILDIGESGDLRDRLRQMRSCMEDDEQWGHAAGMRFARLGMAIHYPLESLEFSYRVTQTKKAAYKLEGHLLNEYVEKHFELPPLNYKFNWS